MTLLEANYRLGDPLPDKVAVVRALPGLGDLLCWIPALRALRMALPNMQLTWIGLPESAALTSRFSAYIDSWLPFPGYPGIPEVPVLPQHTVSFLMQTQQSHFDLALQMHGSGLIINSFTLLLGARQNAGFFPSEQYCPDPDRFLAYPDQESEVWRHLRLMQFLGIPLQGDHLEFPLRQSDQQEFAAIAAMHDLTNYICIHPGASVSTKRWSASDFAAVAARLAAQGYQIVLTGTAAEAELTGAIAQIVPSIDLAGQTSLGAMAILLKRAHLLICNDTGVSHLAAALRVKSVVIFSSSDPQRWAPLDRQWHRVVELPKHWSDSIGATAEAVLAAANDLLQGAVYV